MPEESTSQGSDRLEITVHGATLPSNERKQSMIAAGLGDSVEEILEGYGVECEDAEVMLYQKQS